MFDFKEQGVTAYKLHFTAAHTGPHIPVDRGRRFSKRYRKYPKDGPWCRYERDNAMVLFIGVPGVEESGAIYLFTANETEQSGSSTSPTRTTAT
jgi:hypothetical protein